MTSVPTPRLAASLLLVALAAAAGAAPPRREVGCAPADDGFRSPGAIAHYLEARLAGLRGNREREAEELRQALAFDEGDVELRAAYAEALAAAGRIDAAEPEARRALACGGTGRATSAAHLLLGRILVARRQPDLALPELRAAMAIEAALAADGERGDPEPWREAAELQAGRGDLDGAEATLAAGASAVKADRGGFRELGRLRVERRDLAGAARALRKAVELERGDQEAWRMLAQVEERLRERVGAREAWSGLLRLDPEDAEALLGLGRLALLDDDVAAGDGWFRRHLRAAGDGPEPRLRVAMEWLEARRPEEALQLAREGLAARPGEGRLQLAAGLALLDLRRWGEAAAVLGEVSPGAGELWFSARASMAYALSRDGQHQAALEALAKPLAARPGDPRLVALQANVLLRTGREAEALELLRALRADRLRLGDQAALVEIEEALGDALLRSGHVEDAVAGLRRAVEAQPAEPTLRYALGVALAGAGRSEEAVAQMRELLALTPDDAEALNFIGYWYADQGIRLDEAETLLRRALWAAPRRGHIVDSLGWLMLRKGEVARAVELLERAAQLEMADPQVLEHLGDAYRAAGRAADAAAAYRRALGCFGEEPRAEQVRLRAALERKLNGLAATAR